MLMGLRTTSPESQAASSPAGYQLGKASLATGLLPKPPASKGRTRCAWLDACTGLFGTAKEPSLVLVIPSKRHLGWYMASQPGRASRPRTEQRDPFPGPNPGDIPRVPPVHGSLPGRVDLQFGIAVSAWAGQSELSAPANNSSTATPSIPAPAQSIAFCVSSQCTAAHVHTQKNTNWYKLPSRQSLRTYKLLKNQSTFQGGNAVNWKGKNVHLGF